MVSIGNFDVDQTLNGDYASHTFDVSNFSELRILAKCNKDTSISLYWSGVSPYLSYRFETFLIEGGISFYQFVKIKGKFLNIVYSSSQQPINLRCGILFYK